MKKILFASVCALTMTLTSCFKDVPFTQTADFARIVTINRDASPLQLDADYTGEEFKLENLTMPEQLSLFGLENADRAFAYIHFETTDMTKSTLTLNSADPIKVNPVWNRALPMNASINPLTDLYRMSLDSSFDYPYVWVAGKYLNVSPVIRSMGRGTYYLQPKAVYGDTLRFDMAAEYAEALSQQDVVDFINFDLATLADTADATGDMLATVRTMIDAIEKNDSVFVMLTGDFRQSYHKVDTLADGSFKYEKRDTIVKRAAYAGYTDDLKAFFK